MEISMGFGIRKKLVLKKYRYRKYLLSEKISELVSEIIWYKKKVSDSVSENNWYRKKYQIRYRKKIGIEKSIGFGIGKNWYRKKNRIPYQKKFGIEKSIGFGIGNIWY